MDEVGTTVCHLANTAAPLSIGTVPTLPVDDARTLLGRLTAVHMVNKIGVDRYAFHDLVKEYTQELPGDAAEGVQRLYGYFRERAGAAALRIDRHRPERGPAA
jgi:hypothetical protein